MKWIFGQCTVMVPFFWLAGAIGRIVFRFIERCEHYNQKESTGRGWTGGFSPPARPTYVSPCARCIKHLCGTQRTTLIDTCLLGHQGLAFERLNQFPTLWRDKQERKHKARVHKATRWNAHTHSMIQSSTLSIQRDLFIFVQKRSSSDGSSDGSYTKRGSTGWRYSVWIAVRVESIIDSPSGYFYEFERYSPPQHHHHRQPGQAKSKEGR